MSIQESLWTPPAYSVDELLAAMKESPRNASLIPWSDGRNPAAAIEAAKLALSDLGWRWNEAEGQMEGFGQYVWFRSQGELAPPIAQWGTL